MKEMINQRITNEELEILKSYIGKEIKVKTGHVTYEFGEGSAEWTRGHLTMKNGHVCTPEELKNAEGVLCSFPYTEFSHQGVLREVESCRIMIGNEWISFMSKYHASPFVLREAYGLETITQIESDNKVILRKDFNDYRPLWPDDIRKKLNYIWMDIPTPEDADE